MTVVKTFRSEIHRKDFWRIVKRYDDHDLDIVKSGDKQYDVEEHHGKIAGWCGSLNGDGYDSIEEAEREVTKRTLVQAVNACDGYEVHREQWMEFEELLKEKRIASLGSPRGPGGDWRRAEPLEVEE